MRGERTLCQSLQESKRSGKSGRDREETVRGRLLASYNSQIFICILDSCQYFRFQKPAYGPSLPLSLSHGLAKDIHSCKTQQRMPSRHRRSLIPHRIWLERCSGLTLHVGISDKVWANWVFRKGWNALPIHVSSDRYWKASRFRIN